MMNQHVIAKWSADNNWYPAIIHKIIVPGVRYEVRYYEHENVVETREVTQIQQG